MAAPTISWDPDVISLAPELAGLTVSAQESILEQVAEEVGTKQFGTQNRTNIAAVWLARHLGALELSKSFGGQLVQSVRAGDVSKTFQAPQVAQTVSAQAFNRTGYGIEYLRLCRLWLPRFAVT
jgi:hypothetical protein